MGLVIYQTRLGRQPGSTSLKQDCGMVGRRVELVVERVGELGDVGRGDKTSGTSVVISAGVGDRF